MKRNRRTSTSFSTGNFFLIFYHFLGSNGSTQKKGGLELGSDETSREASPLHRSTSPNACESSSLNSNVFTAESLSQPVSRKTSVSLTVRKNSFEESSNRMLRKTSSTEIPPNIMRKNTIEETKKSSIKTESTNEINDGLLKPPANI